MSAAAIAEQLATAEDIDTARSTVAALRGQQLQEVADKLGVTIYGRVAQKRQQLLYFGVERRLDLAAIRGATR